MDISVFNEAWGSTGEDNILRYSLERNDQKITIQPEMGYLDLFNRGGPIFPLNYLSRNWGAFRWDFPSLDFKVLNGTHTPLFLTEVILDVEESRPDEAPLFAIKKDTQRRQAGKLVLVNEGWCDISDITAFFKLLPGEITNPTDFERPFDHSATFPLFADYAELDVVQAFQEEGVDIEGLIQLGNGKWDQGALIVQKPDGSDERISEAELDKRWKECLGKFQGEVGTLVGEFTFGGADDQTRKRSVKFHAPVYLSDLRKMGIPRPPSYMYDTAFETQKTGYQRRVQISQTLQPGEADRFTVKIAVAQSSFHRFRVTLRDVSGMILPSLPIGMRCFVPRSKRRVVENLLVPVTTK
jgi:hypothetical protein